MHFIDVAGPDATPLVYDSGVDTLRASFATAFDKASNKTSSTEVVGAETYSYAWTYDGINRLVVEQLDAGNVALDYTDTYKFDAASNRLEVDHDDRTSVVGSAGDDYITTYSYDANDRLTSEVKNFSATGSDANTVYNYDNTTQTGKHVREGTTVGAGNDVTNTTFSYDVMGRMDGVTITEGAKTTRVSYAYDHNGIRRAPRYGAPCRAVR